jgi:hypothetical protein
MADKCGAKTRAGGRCQQAGMPNGRCRYHGGLSTGPKNPNSAKNALLHGMYARHFSDEEMAASAETKVGSVEMEIRICRMRLGRALAAENAAKDKPELEEIVKRDVSKNVGARNERKWRVRDYGRVINDILSRIESLEKTRLLLLLEADPAEDSPTANTLTPGSPDEAPPPNPIR